MPSGESVSATYLQDIRRSYRNYRALAERALAQVTDEQLGLALDDEDNSLAVIVQHVAGNLQSRFRDFLTADGEKPDRNRDAEFEQPHDVDRAALMARWTAGAKSCTPKLARLKPIRARCSISPQSR